MKMRAPFLLLLLAGLSLAQICPPAEVLQPCICIEELKSIRCSGITASFDLKGVFDNASSFVNDDVLFESLGISRTPLLEIREGDIEHLKFKAVYIDENPQLEYIYPGAFNASRNFTTVLALSYNRLGRENLNELFQFVRSFPNLKAVNLDWNILPSIPDNAFQNLHSLESISLSSNRISGIGSNAFATGGNVLAGVGLYNNSIPSAGLPEEAFNGLGRSNWTTFSLQQNDMEFMEEESFRYLLENAGQVRVGLDNCQGGCTRFHCDERADWICDVVGGNRRRLIGYFCKIGDSGADDIFEYCAGRNNAIN